MGVSVLILGHSGSGKSTSLRNMPEKSVGIFNVAGKQLPFRRKMELVSNKPGYSGIRQSLFANKLNCYVIDDANFLMAFENFAKAHIKGFDKYTDMAVNFERLLECANSCDNDTIVYFMMHPEYDDAGRLKPKTIGKMLDNQLTVEAMFPVVLVCENDENGHYFLTKSDGLTPAKTPIDMFAETRIDNDLFMVDSVMREYWGLSPLKNSDKEEER